VTDIIIAYIYACRQYLIVSSERTCVCSVSEKLMTTTGPSAYKPMCTERHVTFTFALKFRSSFATLSVSQPKASTSVNRYLNVNVNVKVCTSANVGINILRKQA